MKKCPYCGKEYPDDVVRCLIDDEVLLGGEQASSPPPSPLSETDTPATPPALEPASTSPPALVLTDRQMRIFEVILVCAIAFGTNILSSVHSLSGHITSSSSSGEYKWIYAILRQASCLGLLWYVLRRTGRTFFDLGFSWARTDIGWSLLLKLCGSAGFYAVYYTLYYTKLTAVDGTTSSAHVGLYLFGGHVAIMALLFQFLNPFFEELIVRAYVMTEVKYLTNSVGKAIFVSTALQTSYHFYQGAPVALAHGATFLIYSIYYAKTNRITPIILAHLYTDVAFTLLYFFHR
jgi:membrane protease YdiL (CAAX protease family)